MNHHYLHVSGRPPIPYDIRFSRRARRLSLRISADDGLLIVVPHHFRDSSIDFDGLLCARAGWIVRKMDVLAQEQQLRKAMSFRNGTRLPFLGKEITLTIVEAKGSHGRVHLTGPDLHIVTPSSSDDAVKGLVQKWYIATAKSVIPERVEVLNRGRDFVYRRVLVRNQKSRWGSCSRGGTLSFNWRLLLVPTVVMDYLIYHELAHLREMNHSIRFWKLVQQLCPSFQHAEQWLKSHARLMFW